MKLGGWMLTGEPEPPQERRFGFLLSNKTPEENGLNVIVGRNSGVIRQGTQELLVLLPEDLAHIGKMFCALHLAWKENLNDE